MKGWKGLVLVLSLVTAGLLLGASASAQGVTKIIALSHQVHMDAVTGSGSGGEHIDLSPQLKEQGVEIQWQTVPWPDMQQRIFREVSLSNSDVSLVFVIDQWMSPQMVSKLMPLNSYMSSAPIQDFSGIPKGMLGFATVDNNVYGIPMRAYGPVLFYNKELLSAAGFDGPPTTFEQYMNMAQKVAGRRSDGARVYGVRFEPESVIDWARAFGGDGIDSNFQIHFTEKPMITAIQYAQKLYKAGAIPQNFMSLKADDYLTLMENGQIAFSERGPTYYNTINDPKASHVAGKIGVANVPLSESQGSGVVPGNISFWMMAIPKNDANPDAAWKAIRYLSSDQAALDMALNGNAPTKLSVYDNPQFEKVAGPYLAAAKKSLEVARPDWPPFDNQAKAKDIFDEQVGLAVVGKKTAEQAMADAAKAIKPLLPGN